MNKMTEETLKEAINILSKIANDLNLPFWSNWSFWLTLVSAVATLVSVIALVITLIFLIKYTRATEKIAEYQVMPAIDVKMIHSSKSSPPSTYFWFSNESNSPGWVYLSWVYSNKKDNKTTKGGYNGLRIAPNEKGIKTADSFFPNPGPGDEVNLGVLIKSAFKKLGDEELNIKIEFEKSYKFDGKHHTWNDTSWSYPVDRPFPFPQQIKRCPGCKSEIDIEAQKCKYCLSVIAEEEKSNERN